MPSGCTGCDCPCLLGNLDYYEAAVEYDEASIATEEAQLSSDQTGYYYYMMQVEECGCGGGMMAAAPTDPSVPPKKVTAAQMGVLFDASMKVLARFTAIRDAKKIVMDAKKKIRDDMAAAKASTGI